ncbi:MAG: hypothetical protein ACYS99_06075 [Planctomycetota bacterium]|jgi:hypothetical protein
MTSEHSPEKENCPFDPERPRGVDCPWEDECPWFLAEGDEQCFCTVGVTPELYLARMLAAKMPMDEAAED